MRFFQHTILAFLWATTFGQAIHDGVIGPAEATNFALVYGYPLSAYAKEVQGLVAVPGYSFDNVINHWVHQRQPLTASFDLIVLPNVDTIYSGLVFDLSYGDIVITVPDNIPTDRYWVLQFSEPWGDVRATVGALNGNGPGKYRITYTPAAAGIGFATGPESAFETSNYAGVINMRTVYGVVGFRIVVANTTEQIAEANRIQDGLDSEIISLPDRVSLQLPKLDNLTFSDLPSSNPEEILTLTARLGAILPSADSLTQPTIDTVLKTAGLDLPNRQYKTPKGLDLATAWERFNETITQYTDDVSTFLNLGSFWRMVRPTLAGSFSNMYAARAYWCETVYLGLTPDQAQYPELRNTLYLESDQAYLVTFSGKPPVQKLGFWSLTAYDVQGFLIPNAIGRYSVGDRSNLTFPDGKEVYGTTEDGPFQVLLQTQTPPQNWTRNWLPVTNNGSFQTRLRWYGPEAGTTNGSYSYPTFEKVPALNET